MYFEWFDLEKWNLFLLVKVIWFLFFFKIVEVGLIS